MPTTMGLWTNAAYAAATACFIKANWTGSAPPEIWFIYLGVVGLHMTADKMLQLRYGPPRDANPQQGTQ